MLNIFRARRATVLVWILLVALIVGLAGFGIGVGGGLAGRDVARVGPVTVDVTDFSRALDQELRTLSTQIGRSLPMEEARQFGIDRMVLGRLVNDAALDAEARRLGLSTGDAAVRADLMAAPAFKGADGGFDRDAYALALERVGMTPAGFEAMLRREATRELISGAVRSAAAMPESATRTVLAYLGERRSAAWLRLDAELLASPVPSPTDAELAAEHAAHPERYTRPETQRITYASVTPAALAAEISIPEDELRAAYEADREKFVTPERRNLDRIGFGTLQEAAAAKARLEAGEVEFDALAAERGLTAAEVALGTVAADTLAEPARSVAFGLTEPGVAGPVETPLGPSLYRVNAILAGSTTSFDEARTDLARDLALEQALAQIANETAVLDDLLAGGATLEEIASETAMELGTIELNADSTGGLADDPAFRKLAAEAEPGVETDLAELADGGLVALRLEEVTPPTLLPLEAVRGQVQADWTAARTVEALTGLAEGFRAELAGGLTLAALGERLGRPVSAGQAVLREQALEGAPAGLVDDIFDAEAKGTVLRPDGSGLVLAQVEEVLPFDPEAPENAQVIAAFETQARSGAADDLLTSFVAAVRDAAGVRVNQNLVEATLARFP